MLERKLYKTKLCILYQRGHCPRQSCSFAHGDAELRRFSGSFSSDENIHVVSSYIPAQMHISGHIWSKSWFLELEIEWFVQILFLRLALASILKGGFHQHEVFTGQRTYYSWFCEGLCWLVFPYLVRCRGRRDYRGNDLRDRLERRHSPRRRYSPARDARSRRAFHDQKLAPYDGGYSHSRSPSKRRHRKKQHLDGQSDVSGSLKMSDDADDQARGGKHLSYDDKVVLEDQLKQAQLDIDMLDDHKCQLEIFLEEKVQEAETLTSRIEELETQLIKEQEECKRITSKIKKFIKAHNRYSRAQEELRRTQGRLQRLGDQLNLETSRFGPNEEDSSVNIVSDGEVNEDNRISPRNDVQNHASPSRKRLRGELAVGEELKTGLSRRRDGFLSGKTKVEKLRSQGPSQVENNIKETEVLDKIPAGNSFRRPLATAIRHKRGKMGSPGTVSLDKVKGSEAGHSLPPTSMAAHAADEFLEGAEVEDKVEAGETATGLENGTSAFKAGFPFPPPPLPKVPQNAYKQYEGDDEDAEVEELDVNMRDADVNSEVEIEQL